MSTAAKPTVHLNGTHPDDLIEGFLEARRAIELAKDALKKHCPNGRDYYVQQPIQDSPFAFNSPLQVATEENWRRINKLEEVAMELMALAEHVDNNRGAR